MAGTNGVIDIEKKGEMSVHEVTLCGLCQPWRGIRSKDCYLDRKSSSNHLDLRTSLTLSKHLPESSGWLGWCGVHVGTSRSIIDLFQIKADETKHS